MHEVADIRAEFASTAAEVRGKLDSFRETECQRHQEIMSALGELLRT
ncbi:hypothetical protein [Nocardia sp. NPDC058705]